MREWHEGWGMRAGDRGRARGQLALLLRHVGNPTLGQVDEIGRGNAKNGVRRAARRPYIREALQIPVDQYDGPAGVTDGWDPANRKAGAVAHEIGVRPADALPQQHLYLLLIDPIDARCD